MPGSRVAPPRLPLPRHAEGLYAPLLEVPGVTACFIGRGMRADRPRGLSIVCCVEEKVPRSRLSPAERLPSHVTWRISPQRTVRVPVDVVVAGEGGLANQLLPIPGPGDHQTGVVVVGPVRGASTVGVALGRDNGGVVITTAGHAVMPGPGVRTFPADPPFLVQMTSAAPGRPPAPFQARVLRGVWTSREDYALLRVSRQLTPANVFEDRWPIGGTVTPTPEQVGMPLVALTTRTRVKVALLGVGWSGRVDQVHIDGAVLTTRGLPGSAELLHPGDSGCVLIDLQRRVIGLLHGYTWIRDTQAWVFLPIHNVLARERAFLA